MDIRIEKSKLSVEKYESLQRLDQLLKNEIIGLCQTEKGRNLQVEYSSVLSQSISDVHYKLTHNASFEFSASLVIVDKVSTLLKDYFNNNPIPNYLLSVNLSFSKKLSQRQQVTKEGLSGKSTESSKENNSPFFPITPRFSFDKIILPPRVFNDLMNAVKIIQYRDLIYNQWGYGEVEPYARCIINMYGPAGTGKTMCAHAIAHHVGKKLLALNYSEIESKYLGEAAKNLASAFDTAQETDSVIFFDEADSFLGKRVQNVTQSSDQALNSLRSQMLILLEKFDGIVIFATNLISNFDEAFMSRIQKHIKFELPDSSQRAEIVKKQIPPRLPLSHLFTNEDFEHISKCGDGLSGREIKNAVFEMLLRKAEDNTIISFSPNDFAEALSAKVESNKQIENEKNRSIKERIMKKMAEKVQNQQSEQNKE